MKKEFETIEWDKKRGGVLITKQTLISPENAENIEDAKQKLKAELREIVMKVKTLKSRAEEIKEILLKLEGKAGSIDPAQPP